MKGKRAVVVAAAVAAARCLARAGPRARRNGVVRGQIPRVVLGRDGEDDAVEVWGSSVSSALTRLEQHSPKYELFSPAMFARRNVYVSFARLDAKYLSDGSCCSHVSPNAPPQPETPLSTCEVEPEELELSVTSYNPWSFFLSPRT